MVPHHTISSDGRCGVVRQFEQNEQTAQLPTVTITITITTINNNTNKKQRQRGTIPILDFLLTLRCAMRNTQ